jgi:cupin-like protein
MEISVDFAPMHRAERYTNGRAAEHLPKRDGVATFSPVARVGAVSRADFHAFYRGPRRPIVLADLTRAWPARERWSLDYLRRVAGTRCVPVYDSQPARGREHQHAASARMAIAAYVERLRAGERDLRIFFLRVVDEIPELTSDFDYPELGLPFVKKLSVLFMAGQGSRVQMHFDIDLADIVLCHFGGKKRVILFAPDQTPYLYRVPFSFSALFGVAPEAPDYERFPALKHARGEIAELEHGDALYIPPGYWHYVLYDEIGMSLSLRAVPRRPRDLLAALYNVAVVRTVDGVMRKFLGQRWNDRNEREAVRRTHAWLERDRR